MKIKCAKCKDVIEGDKKGTYITCKCGAIAIDETKYYWRIIGNKEDIENFDEVLEEDTKVKELKNDNKE